jgi:hypothetical protein
MGRLDLAHQLGLAHRPAQLRLAGRLGVQQAGLGFEFVVADASSGLIAPWAVLGWATSPPPPLPADWAVPHVGLSRIRCSSAWIWCGRQGCMCTYVGAVGVCAQMHARRSAICRRGTRVRQAATSRRRARSPWPQRDGGGGGGVAKVEWLVARLGTGHVGFVRVCGRAVSWTPRVAARRRQGSMRRSRGQGPGLVDGSGVHTRV